MLTKYPLDLVRMIPRGGLVTGGGGNTVVPYEDALINTYGASEVWSLVDIATGTAIKAKVSTARNGTLAGWTLQNSAGPVAGTLAPSFDGTTSIGNILTDSLKAAFNGTVGWMSICLKVSGVGVWTDGALRYALQLYTDGNNYIRIYKPSETNRLNVVTNMGGAGAISQYIFDITSDWGQVVITWDKNAGASGEVGIYANGILQGAIKTGLGAWSGALASGTLIGARTTTPLSVWSGWLAYAAVGFGAALTPQQVADMYDDLTGVARQNFVLAGQSNAAEPATNNQAYTHPALKAWSLIGPTLAELDKGAVGTLSKSCWPLVATSYMAAQNKPILFAGCAEGSTSITAWQKPGVLYSRITTAMGILGWAHCLLWQHGETDAGSGMSTADYQTYLGQFVDDVFADTGLRVMISKLHTCSAAYTAGQQAAINTGIEYVLANNAHALRGPDFSDYTTATVHFASDTEVAVQGARWWAAIKAAFGW